MEEDLPDEALPSATAAAEGQPSEGIGTSASSMTDCLSAVHCPYRRITDLLQRLAPNKMRIGFFIGAGCSSSVQGTDGNPLIPDITGLTDLVKKKLDEDPEIEKVARTAWDRVKARGIHMPTVEDVLSHIRTLKSLCGQRGIDGFSENDLTELDTTICTYIRDIVSKQLPTVSTPYHTLASWIQAIPREKPVEIFTSTMTYHLNRL